MFNSGIVPTLREEVDSRDILYRDVFKISRTAEKFEIDPYDIKDQFRKGTCAFFASGYAVDVLFASILSTLYAYAMGKTHICPFGKTNEGTNMITTMKTLMEFGIPLETEFPYTLYKDAKVFDFPDIPVSVHQSAQKRKISGFVKITTKEEMKDHILHRRMIPCGFVVGLDTFLKPEKLPNGDAVIDLPAGTIAGHGMALCGFNDNMVYTFKSGRTEKGFCKAVQSYGTGESRREFEGADADRPQVWTETGFVWIPYSYVFGHMTFVEGFPARYVNEMYVPLESIPKKITKIDPLNENITPYIKNSRAMVPLRFIGETLGYDVTYSEHSRGISIRKDGKIIKLQVDSKYMQVGNKYIELDAIPEIRDARTFVPIRAIVEGLGASIEYFKHERKVEVRKDDKIMQMWIGYNEARLLEEI